MLLHYAVTRDLSLWTVSESGSAVSQQSSKPEAVELARLLAVATKAAGGGADMLVENEEHELECWDTDRPLPLLGGFLYELARPEEA